MYFRATDENAQLFAEDARFVDTFIQYGVQYILENISGFDPLIHPDVFTLSKNYNTEILSRFKKP
jgi:hypothetical protein